MAEYPALEIQFLPPADASLRDALDAVLRSSTGRILVTDGDRAVGSIDAEIIRRASQ